MIKVMAISKFRSPISGCVEIVNKHLNISELWIRMCEIIFVNSNMTSAILIKVWN